MDQVKARIALVEKLSPMDSSTEKIKLVCLQAQDISMEKEPFSEIFLRSTEHLLQYGSLLHKTDGGFAKTAVL